MRFPEKPDREKPGRGAGDGHARKRGYMPGTGSKENHGEGGKGRPEKVKIFFKKPGFPP